MEITSLQQDEKMLIKKMAAKMKIEREKGVEYLENEDLNVYIHLSKCNDCVISFTEGNTGICTKSNEILLKIKQRLCTCNEKFKENLFQKTKNLNKKKYILGSIFYPEIDVYEENINYFNAEQKDLYFVENFWKDFIKGLSNITEKINCAKFLWNFQKCTLVFAWSLKDNLEFFKCIDFFYVSEHLYDCLSNSSLEFYFEMWNIKAQEMTIRKYLKVHLEYKLFDKDLKKIKIELDYLLNISPDLYQRKLLNELILEFNTYYNFKVDQFKEDKIFEQFFKFIFYYLKSLNEKNFTNHLKKYNNINNYLSNIAPEETNLSLLFFQKIFSLNQTIKQFLGEKNIIGILLLLKDQNNSNNQNFTIDYQSLCKIIDLYYDLKKNKYIPFWNLKEKKDFDFNNNQSPVSNHILKLNIFLNFIEELDKSFIKLNAFSIARYMKVNLEITAIQLIAILKSYFCEIKPTILIIQENNIDAYFQPQSVVNLFLPNQEVNSFIGIPAPSSIYSLKIPFESSCKSVIIKRNENYIDIEIEYNNSVDSCAKRHLKTFSLSTAESMIIFEAPSFVSKSTKIFPAIYPLLCLIEKDLLDDELFLDLILIGLNILFANPTLSFNFIKVLNLNYSDTKADMLQIFEDFESLINNSNLRDNHKKQDLEIIKLAFSDKKITFEEFMVSFLFIYKHGGFNYLNLTSRYYYLLDSELKTFDLLVLTCNFITRYPYQYSELFMKIFDRIFDLILIKKDQNIRPLIKAIRLILLNSYNSSSCSFYKLLIDFLLKVHNQYPELFKHASLMDDAYNLGTILIENEIKDAWEDMVFRIDSSFYK